MILTLGGHLDTCVEILEEQLRNLSERVDEVDSIANPRLYEYISIINEDNAKLNRRVGTIETIVSDFTNQIVDLLRVKLSRALDRFRDHLLSDDLETSLLTE